MRSEGTPQYTQATVAWGPNVWYPSRGVVDEVNVSFEADGGGVHGEFHFSIYQFGERDVAVQIECFIESVEQLQDERIQAVIEGLREDESLENLLALLEQNGIQPSKYHLKAEGRRQRNAIEEQDGR